MHARAVERGAKRPDGAPAARRLPIGAELVGEQITHVRVWAPTHPRVTLVLESSSGAILREVPLEREPDGHHAALVAEMAAGSLYRFRHGDDPQLYPDPASRYQPQGPFGPSQVIDPTTFAWTDAGWRGLAPERHVIYELHVGTFTVEGTYAAAAQWLPYLADVGITTIELMPLNDYPGHHNWGYDGVNLFAPCRNHGTPGELRHFVDRAHAVGLAVILDVVYNHFGPSGNFMFAWCPYFKGPAGEWGESIRFDGPHAGGVREHFVANAGYWIDEFHLDGLRIDATQTIADRSPEHVLAAIARRARQAGGERQIYLVGENEPQDTRLLDAPIALDALWNDDFHHTARIALTGVHEGYFHDYRGSAQELLSAVKRGFLYQGQMYPWQKKPRGRSTRGFARHRVIAFLENHDQVANAGFGERLPEVTDPALLRAFTALLLLSPSIPMLFQGQECGSRRPWTFFVDHCTELQDPIRQGRADFVAQFARIATPEARAQLPDPCLEATYRSCILEAGLRTLDHPTVQLHRDLLKLRREDPAFTDPRETALDGALLSPDVIAVRYFQDAPEGDRLLLVNLGATFTQASIPEPLIAPPPGTGWKLAWSSEDPKYGGHGTPVPVDRTRTTIPARAAVLLAADRASEISISVDDPGSGGQS